MTQKEINIHQHLIDACRENDRTAQVQLYELYYKAMFNTSYRIVHHTTEAEDIMQEAFLDAFKKLDTYKGESSFGSWLKRIVVNRSLDHLKKKKLLTGFDDQQFDIEDATDITDEELDRCKVEEIKKTMEDLPDNYRIILSLYLLEGYDQQEIAEILNISHNNVRIRYMRAKKKLLEQVNVAKYQYLNTLKN